MSDDTIHVPIANAAPPADVASLLQQLQAVSGVAPTVAPPSASVATQGLDVLLAAQMQAQSSQLNPISMLALASTLQQMNPSPIYQNLARMLLTVNMGQLLGSQPADLMPSLSQQNSSSQNSNQESLISSIARGGLPGIGLGNLAPMGQQQHHFSQQQPGEQLVNFAVPQNIVHHMSLKRSMPVSTSSQQDRKKSCPPIAPSTASAHAPRPATPTKTAERPRSRSPKHPLMSIFENMTQEDKKRNEYFQREVRRRLDIILLEELGADDEEEKKKHKQRESADANTAPENVEEKEKETKSASKDDSPDNGPMGAAGSAFRRITSKTESTQRNSSGSNSGATSPSTGSLSSGPNSPPIESEPLSTEFVEMIGKAAKKHRTTVTNVDEEIDEINFSKWYPRVWCGKLNMKSSEAPVSLHLLSGDRQSVINVLGEDEGFPNRGVIKINQRLRMDNGQLGHINRLMTANEFTCCLAITVGEDRETISLNEQKFQTHFIDYLMNKSIAGIAGLGEEFDGKLQASRVHMFPPSDMIKEYLTNLSPNLYQYLLARQMRFMLLVFSVNEGTDSGSVSSAPRPSA